MPPGPTLAQTVIGGVGAAVWDGLKWVGGEIGQGVSWIGSEINTAATDVGHFFNPPPASPAADGTSIIGNYSSILNFEASNLNKNTGQSPPLGSSTFSSLDVAGLDQYYGISSPTSPDNGSGNVQLAQNNSLPSSPNNQGSVAEQELAREQAPQQISPPTPTRDQLLQQAAQEEAQAAKDQRMADLNSNGAATALGNATGEEAQYYFRQAAAQAALGEAYAVEAQTHAANANALRQQAARSSK